MRWLSRLTIPICRFWSIFMVQEKEEEQSPDVEIEPETEKETENIEKTHMNLIIASYRFRLVQLCKGFLA